MYFLFQLKTNVVYAEGDYSMMGYVDIQDEEDTRAEKVRTVIAVNKNLEKVRYAKILAVNQY